MHIWLHALLHQKHVDTCLPLSDILTSSGQRLASHNRSNFLPRDFEYCSLSEYLQRICGSTWWWRAPKRLFSAGWSHMPHLEWEHDRNRNFFLMTGLFRKPYGRQDLLKSARFFFFLWGALKGKAYANKPRTIQELENNIRREIARISEEVLQATFANMKRRVQLCLDSDGERFHHLLQYRHASHEARYVVIYACSKSNE